MNKLRTRPDLAAWRRDASPAPLVIYHSGCPDGTCAAAVAILALGEDTECVPALYGDDPPDVEGRAVYVVDFSYPRAVLEDMAERAASLTVLDHHKTAAADLEGFPGAVFDMERSGAGLVWDTLTNAPRPWLVDYVEDRDLWRYALPDSRAVAAWISTLPLNEPRDWVSLLGQMTLPAHVVEGGLAILEAQANWCAQVAATAERGAIAGHDVPVVNAPHPLGANVLEVLYQGEPFAARWQRGEDGFYRYSLASARGEGLDVSEIARQFGGGGHRHAAGFTADRLVHVTSA